MLVGGAVVIDYAEAVRNCRGDQRSFVDAERQNRLVFPVYAVVDETAVQRMALTQTSRQLAFETLAVAGLGIRHRRRGHRPERRGVLESGRREEPQPVLGQRPA